MSIHHFHQLIEEKKVNTIYNPEDLTNYLGYDYTQSNGQVILVRPWERLDEPNKLSTIKKQIPKPKDPFCYKSIRDFNKRKNNEVPLKIWKTRNDFFFGKKSIKEIRERINKDPDLSDYFRSKERAKLKEFFYPDNSLLKYLTKQNNSPEVNVFHLKDGMYNIAKNISKKCSSLEDKINEIMTALCYDELLRKVSLEENDVLKNNLKKDIIKELSEASNFSVKEIRKYTKILKKEYSKEIFNYKQKNNLLTYRDFKIKNDDELNWKIRRIKERIYENAKNKNNYEDLAKKFGLKNKRVVMKIVSNANSDLYSNIYKYEEQDSYERVFEDRIKEILTA